MLPQRRMGGAGTPRQMQRQARLGHRRRRCLQTLPSRRLYPLLPQQALLLAARRMRRRVS